MHDTRSGSETESPKKMARKNWSGRRDSNPCLDLGKVPYYPYTTTASRLEYIARPHEPDKSPTVSLFSREVSR